MKERTKEVAKVIFGKAVNFVKENGKNFAVTALAEALEVPVTTMPRNYYSSRNDYSESRDHSYIYPRNSAEAAISSLCSSALKMSFDSRKVETAKKIFEIANGKDDQTVTYAICSLNKIQSTLSFDSAKSDIGNLIAKLANSVPDE